MRVLRGQDLLQGSDHEFITNLYRRILLRGPDDGGYRHYRDRIEADPGCRRRMIEELAGSSEARRQPEPPRIIWDDGELPAAPAPVAVAPAAPPTHAAAKSPEDLLAELRQSVVGLDATRLVAVEANLLACLGDVRTARLAALAKGRA
ncbi:MAG: hypothetical protein RL312_713 [Pseudomonadota bacterium]|jgi:hypothetical protein